MRHQHLLTQAELAERCGLDRAQLCRYEKGAVEPSLAAPAPGGVARAGSAGPARGGGELAAGPQGVPIIDPDMVLHLRLPHLAAFAAVVREARCVLAKPGPVGLYDEPEEPAPEDELVVRVGSGTLRLQISDALPATAVVTVDRRIDDEGDTIAVPVVELAVLCGRTRPGSRGTRRPDRHPPVTLLPAAATRRRSPGRCIC